MNQKELEQITQWIKEATTKPNADENIQLILKLASNSITQEKELQALQDEIKPMQEYLRAFQDAIDGKKPFSKAELRKQIVGLIASYKQLEKEKSIKDKDSDFLFSELRKLEKKIPELERYKEYVEFIHTHAPRLHFCFLPINCCKDKSKF